MYLYGTPSDSGNIGLRVGDAVTYYDGIVAQNIDEVWTDKTKYPCALISSHSRDDDIVLRLCADIEYHDSASVGTIIKGPYQRYILTDGKWVYDYTYSGNSSYSQLDLVLYWSNVDIYDKDGTEKVLAKSYPISVSGLVGNSYNGTMLPKLPEYDTRTYPYALISFNSAGSYSLRCFTAEPAKSTTGSTLLPQSGTGQYISCTTRGEEWGSFGEPSNFTYLLGSVFEGRVWTNFDLCTQGSDYVWIAASDPVPVYEKRS